MRGVQGSHVTRRQYRAGLWASGSFLTSAKLRLQQYNHFSGQSVRGSLGTLEHSPPPPPPATPEGQHKTEGPQLPSGAVRSAYGGLRWSPALLRKLLESVPHAPCCGLHAMLWSAEPAERNCPSFAENLFAFLEAGMLLQEGSSHG